MKLEDLFKTELSLILKEDGFVLEEDGGGYQAVKNYRLGKKIIFFELSNKGGVSFKVGISVKISNLPVQRIQSLVNSKNAVKSVVSLRLDQLARRFNNRDANFERKIFNGQFGNLITSESLIQYIINFKLCFKVLISPFFDIFFDQESFNEWLNDAVLDGRYNFESEPVWKDAISSLIIAKLVGSKRMEELYQKWLEQELPKGPGFDTREELIKLKDILDEEVNG